MMLPTPHELLCFLMGFTGGLTVMGFVGFILHVRRVLNAPQLFIEECLVTMRRDFPLKTNQ